MNRNSISNLKNIFSAKEQLTISQQLNIRGGDGEDDDKRRDGAKGLSSIISSLPKPTVNASVTIKVNTGF